MSNIFKASLIIGISFGLNKILGFLRQYLIASQFGFTPEIDAFNVANNVPDLIFSLFSGGALAMAFIPVFAEYLDIQGRDMSWKLFSKVATLLCIATATASIIIAIMAPLLVRSQLGIAPGFSSDMQALVVTLLRINLIATFLFSISGLVTASLHAHKHFLLPAISPLFYNLGIIIGVLFFSPTIPIIIWGYKLPTLGLGIYGLTYGVVLGALLHFIIQLPGILHFKFNFSFSIDLKDVGVRKILRLMAPRILTVFFIQVMFILRDNFASRLEIGSVTALTYGYFIMQVPETLIGTSIATALLPTLSAYVSQQKKKEFGKALTNSIRVLIAISIITTVLLMTILTPIIDILFNFSSSHSAILVKTTQAFMLGLLANVLLEVLVRAFYAKQSAAIPLYATALRALVFITLGVIFYQKMGPVGIAMIDTIAVTVEVLLLSFFLVPLLHEKANIGYTLLRTILGSIAGFSVMWSIFTYVILPPLIQIPLALIVATAVSAIFVRKELSLLIKL
jgi:putative peptidoglycan lipid II flippase